METLLFFFIPKEPGMYVVKRIIGVPGDRIHLRDGKVYQKRRRTRMSRT